MHASRRRQAIVNLAQVDFLAEAGNVVVPRPTGNRKDTSVDRARGPGVPRDYRVSFATRTLVGQPPRCCQARGQPRRRARGLGRIPLLVIDEVGYIPFDPEAAALFFALISSREERSCLILN
jgi:hypothetical protein